MISDAKDVPVFAGLLIGLPIGALLWIVGALIYWSLT